MNRVGSLVFATATTALTGAAVVMAAGGTLFGQAPGGPSQKADTTAAPAPARANPRTAAGQDSPAFAVESGQAAEQPLLAANPAPSDPGGWSQGQSAGQEPAVTVPPQTELEDRATPPAVSTPAPARPASTPTTAPKTAPAATQPPQAPDVPTFSFTAPDPTSPPKSQAVAPPTSAPPPPTAAPSQPPQPSGAVASATPRPRSDDDRPDREEPEHEDEHEDD